jgi:hypothetical protein
MTRDVFPEKSTERDKKIIFSDYFSMDALNIGATVP